MPSNFKGQKRAANGEPRKPAGEHREEPISTYALARFNVLQSRFRGKFFLVTCATGCADEHRTRRLRVCPLSYQAALERSRFDELWYDAAKAYAVMKMQDVRDEVDRTGPVERALNDARVIQRPVSGV